MAKFRSLCVAGVIALSSAMATAMQAQTVSRNFNSQPLKSVLHEIERQTKMSVIVNDINLNKRVTANFNKTPLRDVLKQVLDESCEYEIADRIITIHPSRKAKQETQHQGKKKKQTVKGCIKDENGDPIIGASILVKGTTTGTITDADGRYSLDVPSGSTIQISYLGYQTKEVKAQGGSDMTVFMDVDNKTLDDVVVTAFGIKREEKALGYAVQKVKGDELATVKSVDLGTSLTGKVAGLNVQNSTEFNDAPSVLIRGENPLIVLDGVPYSNISLRDINADDVESIDVLKGATASALYGARGGSGVITITTKKGSKEGLDITVNSSTMFNAGYLAIPEAQHDYSSGSGGHYDSVDYVWGDKLDIGRKASQYNPKTYQWEETELVSKGKNNFRNFLQQGFVTNNNISLGWRGKNGGVRTSLNHVFNRGQYPNEDMHKIIYTLSGNAKIGKLSLEGGAVWNKRFYNNDRGSGYSGGGYIYNIIVWTGSNYDIRDYRNYWVEGKENQKQNWLYNYYYDNPYFLAYECTRSNDYDKLNTYAYAKYELLPWLNISTRTGVDFYASRTETKNPIGQIHGYYGNVKGYYGVSKATGFSVNNDVILAADKKLGDFDIDGMLGSTIYYYNNDDVSANTNNGLSVPGYYSLKASVDPVSASSSYKSKRVNSLWGRLSVAWRNTVYLDVTGRNDWSSTLPADTRSYFYPSVSGSVIMSEFLHLPQPFTFWKLRGSWTVTKYDLDIFETQQAYSVSSNVWNKMNTATYPSSLRASTLKPTTKRAYEIGTQFNVWNNRIRFDLAYYNTLKYNNTRKATVSAASGFTSTLINYGEKQERRGFEIAVGADVIKKKDLNWTVNLNWASDRYYYNTIDPVYSTQNQWVQNGKRWDWVADLDWDRDPDGNMILYNGLPQRSKYKKLAGYANPDWIWGINTQLRYKNWTLNLAVDGRVGGLAYNKTEQAMWNSGSHPKSATPERYEEVVNGNKTFVAKGVKIVSGSVKYDVDGNILEDTRVFAPNDVVVSYQNFIQRYEPWCGAAAFQNYRSTTFFKIRELSLTYDVPKKICAWARMKSASVSFIGQNMLLWAKEFKYADPDVSSDDLSSPSQRFLGFNIKVQF